MAKTVFLQVLSSSYVSPFSQSVPCFSHVRYLEQTRINVTTTTKVLPNTYKNNLAVKPVNESNWQPKQLISEAAKNKNYVNTAN